MESILVVIPARGGSKGIPRKNLRLLGSRPLIYYSIKNALNSSYSPDVYVTTEDDEISLLAQKFGAKVHNRSQTLADDGSTLDPVVFSALNYAEKQERKKYDIIITMQPTSPLLLSESVDEGVKLLLENENIDTVISAQDDTHLTWKKKGAKFVPNYEERLNRQYLSPVYKETGGFLISRREIVGKTNRIGENVELFLLKEGQEIDIDTYNDWNLCEYILRKKKILFIVAGNEEIGLGHVYNTLIIANDILNHDVEFLVPKKNFLAFEKIASKNYKVRIQEEDIVEEVKAIKPDVVINDLLDTDASYVKALKSMGIKTVNFEDLGEGAKYADLVINAIYPENKKLKNHYFGQNYFILRDEFIFNYSNKQISKEVEEILITFGGVDPCNLTECILSSVYDYCLSRNIKINIVTGSGYTKYETLEKYSRASLNRNISNISDYMYKADIVFTSAGRTVYEVASIGTPAIVLAQNEREMTHFFAAKEHGFLHLGMGKEATKERIMNAFIALESSQKAREKNHKLMISQNLKLGRKRVQTLIINLIQNT